MAERKRTGANHARKTQARRQVIRTKTAGMGRRIAGMTSTLFIAAVCIGAVVFAVMNAPRVIGLFPALKVGSISVQDTPHMKKQEVLAAGGISAGMMLSDVNPARIAEALRKNPWIGEVVVRRGFPGTVSITVRERIPVALVSLGTVYQIDREGVLLDMPRGMSVDLPAVTGVRDTVHGGVRRIRRADMDRVNALFDAAAAMDPALARRIAQVDFPDDATVRMIISGSSAVIIMDGRDLRTQMAHLGRVMENAGKGGAIAARRISLCYENLAFVEQADNTTHDQ